MLIQDQIRKDLTAILEKLNISSKDLKIEHPVNFEHGDYATNIAMQTKTKEDLIPFDLANKIVDTWRASGLPEYLAKIEIAKPGFINFWLDQKFLINQLSQVIKEKEKYGSEPIGKGKTVVIDYSSPNIAKFFGIGHLRSTIIGQAIYNLYQFLGYRTVGVNHLGDWGTQFGKLIVAIKKWNKGNVNDLTFEKLEKLYVKFHSRAEKDPKLEDEARLWFKKLGEKDPEAKKIWQACIEISLKEFDRIYELLGIKIDHCLGESFYEDKSKDIIDLAKRKKVAVKSQGALVIKLPELKIPPALLLKSDGATTYWARDLACIAYRQKRWQPDLYLYEVGVDQQLHFKQTFASAVKLGLGKIDQFVHISHGLIRLQDGKMSTRRGKTIHLEKVLNESIKKAEKIITKAKNKKEIGIREQKSIAQAVGIGAVKYFDLSHHRSSDIVFDWDKIFILEGNSAPYLQYTYARCLSILNKQSEESINDSQEEASGARLKPEEITLLRTIYKFPEILIEAANSFAPNLVCNFLFDLAQKYNLFYNRLPILGAERKEIIQRRLFLTLAVSQLLKNGLQILGIETPERM